MAECKALHVVALPGAEQQDLRWQGAFVPNAPFQQSGVRTASLGGGHGGTHRDRLGSLLSPLGRTCRQGKAVTATARKIAVLFYNTLRHGMGYADPGASYYEDHYRQRALANPKRRAKSLGYAMQLSEHTQSA